MDKMNVLLKELEQVPEYMLDETLDFVRFLKANPDLEWKETTNCESNCNDKSAWMMEWLTPEENKEWQEMWAAMW